MTNKSKHNNPGGDASAPAPIVCGIYARKSTSEDTKSPDAKSTTRQVEHATAYAAKSGWVVDPGCVFVDDNVSGALGKDKRPGLARLLNALDAPTPPFRVLLMSEESRLGRDRVETEWNLKQIVDSDVRVIYYMEDREARLDDATGSLLEGVRLYAAQIERERAAQRVFDAQIRKARAGHVAGGAAPYGYQHVPILGDGGLRTGVRLEVDPEEARVVQGIFEAFVAGAGSTTIAAKLNREGVPAPRRGRAWAQTCIRGMLGREVYIGRTRWGRIKTTVRKGRVRHELRPESEWVIVANPALRIIPQELWARVQARRKRNATVYPRRATGQLLGRPNWADGHSEYLLVGHAQCALCGRAVRTVFSKFGVGARRYPVRSYGCGTRQSSGVGGCANNVLLRQDVLDAAVLRALAPLLDAELVEAAVRRAVKMFKNDQAPLLARMEEVDKALRALDKRIQRAVDALLDGDGGDIPEVRSRLAEYRSTKSDLEAERATLEAATRAASLDMGKVVRMVREAAGGVAKMLQGEIPQARQMLRKLLDGPIVFEPFREGGRRGYRFTGRLTYDGLLSGEAGVAVRAVLARKAEDRTPLTVTTPRGRCAG